MRANKAMDNVSRADLIRQRRAQRSQKTVSRTRQAASHPIPSQPVIVRGTHPTAARPLRKVAQTRVRRQYYYTLGSTGAELRLPAIPFIRPDWRVLSGLLVIALLLALYGLATSPTFLVQQYEVQGIQRLTFSDIEAVLGLQGTKIIEFNAAQAKEKLAAAFPELQDIQVRVGLPAKVTIQVNERTPVVSWNTADGSYWIDAEGTILPPRGEVETLVQVSTNGLPALLNPAPLEAAAADSDAARQIPVTAGVSPVTVWGQNIDPKIIASLLDLQARIPPESSLVYDTINGLGWKDPRGWDVFIGKDLSNFEEKMNMYEYIIVHLELQGKLPTQMVSVEYVNAPFYK
jgi:cell division protein FtsQ